MNRKKVEPLCSACRFHHSTLIFYIRKIFHSIQLDLFAVHWFTSTIRNFQQTNYWQQQKTTYKQTNWYAVESTARGFWTAKIDCDNLRENFMKNYHFFVVWNTQAVGRRQRLSFVLQNGKTSWKIFLNVWNVKTRQCLKCFIFQIRTHWQRD